MKVFDKSSMGNQLLGQGKMNLASTISALLSSRENSTSIEIPIIEVTKFPAPVSSASSPLIASATGNQQPMMSKGSSSSSLEVVEGSRTIGTVSFKLQINEVPTAN